MSEPTVACWNCGTLNDTEADYCTNCAEFLRTAATGMMPSVGGEAVREAAVAAAGTGQGTAVLPPLPGVESAGVASQDASIVLEPADPGSVGPAGWPLVEAGSSLAFLATVRNESRIVDNYELVVHGLRDTWSVVSPAAVFLVPFGSGGASDEQLVRIDIAPPREPASSAMVWGFELLAYSQSSGRLAARATAQFEIKPFQAWSTEATPLVRAGRFRARYRVAVRNDGNHTQDFWMVAADDAERLKTSFRLGRMEIWPGEVGVDELTLKPPFPLPTGRRIEHRASVDALPAPPELPEEVAGPGRLDALKGQVGADIGPKGVKLRKPRLKLPTLKPPKIALDAGTLARMRGEKGASESVLTGRPVVFRQKPIVPLWFLVLLAVLAGAAYLVYTLLPERVDVPALVGVEDAFTADKRLRDAGLVLAQPIQKRTAPDAPPGSVIGQSPEAGSRVEEGETVAIEVAAGTDEVGVPRLAGLTRANADERLRKFGLSLGDAQPADAPDNFIVRSQIPRPRLAVARGTPVRVFLKAPPVKKKKGGGDDDDAAGGGGGGGGGDEGGGGGGRPVTIPAVNGRNAEEYAAALEELDLKPRVTSVVAAVTAGRVLSTDPQPGERARTGDTVQVRASSGTPPIAIETEGLVQLINPINGRPTSQLPDGEGSAVEPTFTPDGTQVLYRADRRLVLAGIAKGSKSRTLYAGDDALELPSIAPNGRTVAVLRRLEEDGDLCFGKLTGRDLDQLCLADDGWNLFGRPAWRQDGRILLVPAHKDGDPKTFGLRLYQTSKPFSTSPQDYAGRTTTDVSTPGKGVIAVAFSPGGTTLAAVTNLLSASFEVVTAPAADLELVEPETTKVRGCDFAWRPDGKELTVVSSNATCSTPLGKVERFLLSRPEQRTQVADEGRNPVYVPVRSAP